MPKAAIYAYRNPPIPSHRTEPQSSIPRPTSESGTPNVAPDDLTHVQKLNEALTTSESKSASSVASTHEAESEDQMSDPGGGSETLKIFTAGVEIPLGVPATQPRKDPERFANRLLAISAAYADAGVSRSKTPAVIQNFLALFGFGLRYAGTQEYVPFTGAGLSYAACQAYCELDPAIDYKSGDIATLKSVLPAIRAYYFYPSPSVRLIAADAKTRNKWVVPGTEDPKPGWLVLYSWTEDGYPNHIGVVDRFADGVLHDVEYNTNTQGGRSGGSVARRVRDLRYVLGYVRIW